jgi:hypothetical protein
MPTIIDAHHLTNGNSATHKLNYFTSFVPGGLRARLGRQPLSQSLIGERHFTDRPDGIGPLGESQRWKKEQKG